MDYQKPEAYKNVHGLSSGL